MDKNEPLSPEKQVKVNKFLHRLSWYSTVLAVQKNKSRISTDPNLPSTHPEGGTGIKKKGRGFKRYSFIAVSQVSFITCKLSPLSFVI